MINDIDKLAETIVFLRKRLEALNSGRRLTWSLDDRAAVSHLIFQLTDTDSLFVRLDNLEAKLNRLNDGINILDTQSQITNQERN
jgi:hypothetical protein